MNRILTIAGLPAGAALALLVSLALGAPREEDAPPPPACLEEATAPTPTEIPEPATPPQPEVRPAPAAPELSRHFDTVGRALSARAILRLGRMWAQDAGRAAELRAALEPYLRSDDPELHRRAEILRIELDGEWEAAVASHADPEVRRALLERPPLDDPERTDAVIDALLEVAANDENPELRVAALRGLPVSIDASATARLVGCLADDDPEVVRTAIAVLAGARTRDAGAIQALRDLAAGDEFASEAERALRKCHAE